jgi:hypothetical protein
MLLVLILLLPYRMERRRDHKHREYGVWQSLVWHWEYGPDYQQFNLKGLRRLQGTLLQIVITLWSALRVNLLQQILEELRRRLGL